MVAQVTPGLKKAVLAGVFIGSLIAIMRYGVYHSMVIATPDLDSLTVMNMLWVALDLFVVLAGLLCGYIVAARASRTWPVHLVARYATISGFVAGMINLLAMVLIYFPQEPSRWNQDVLEVGLNGILYFVEIVVLSLAGAAIYAALVRKPRHAAAGGWRAGAAVGIVIAVLVASAYYLRSILVETYMGFIIHSSYDSLIILFAVNAFVLFAAVLAGFFTAMLARRSALLPNSYVISAALAGLVAGFIGSFANELFNRQAIVNYFPGEFSGYEWLNIALQILYGVVLMMTLAIGGSVYYALWYGETKLVSAGSEEPVKQP